MRRKLREIVRLGLLVLIAGLLVALVRARLFSWHKRVKDTHDVYFLPPPEQLVTLSLGYRAALADVLWAHVLVSQGFHTFQRRRFENLLGLYDAINTLAPTWRTPYLLADALITFQSSVTPVPEVIKAREILERGVAHLPYDADIWLNLGQFVVFVAPASYLAAKPALAARWRHEGVKYLERAAELGGGSPNVSWQALGGANILAHEGEMDAALRFWQRTYAVTDDEELKQEIRRKIAYYAKALGHEKYQRQFEAYRQRDEAFVRKVRQDLPFINRRTALVLGPAPHPAHCAGGGRDSEPACATTWRQWAERHDAANRSQPVVPRRR